MEIVDAALTFQALAHETRLKAFRLIISAGKDGLPAGEIARLLEVPASTLSSHLGILERSGLIQSWRIHRSIYYAVDEDGVRGIVSFLTRNCCRGEPELCGFQVQEPPPRRKTRKSA
jgi:DNA-binding transcriptional ArsR family regulator